jgi:hypothetical protein
MREFLQVDVFTAEPYRGNPLAVVLDADGLSDVHTIGISGSNQDASLEVRAIDREGGLTPGSRHAASLRAKARRVDFVGTSVQPLAVSKVIAAVFAVSVNATKPTSSRRSARSMDNRNNERP